MTDEELKDLVAAVSVQQRETDRMIRESLQETDRQIRENDRRLKEQIQETDRELKAQIQETNRQLKETDRQLKKQSQELGRQIGGLGDKFGSFTEGLALPSMTKILTQRFKMDVISPRVLARNNGHSMEVDVLAYSERKPENEVVVVEVKSHLREEALEQMKKMLRDFHKFFPGHRGKKVYGMLAAVDAPEALRKKVLAEGLYLARIHDGQFELQVPDDFAPRAF